MIEKRYILERKTFKVGVAYIEPESEWRQTKIGDNWVKIFNDIDPTTKQRTGRYYCEYDVFCSIEEGKDGLCNYIKELIECNRQQIEILESRNKELLNILMTNE